MNWQKAMDLLCLYPFYIAQGNYEIENLAQKLFVTNLMDASNLIKGHQFDILKQLIQNSEYDHSNT